MRARLLALFLCLTSRADSPVEVHNAAHFGMSYAVTTMTYGVSKFLTNEDRAGSLFLAVCTGALVGVVKELSDARVSSKNLLADGLGIGAAATFIVTFDF